MDENKFSFQSQNLVVDYITFKFQHLNTSRQTEITNYLFKIGFNVYEESGKLIKPIKQSILVDLKNRYETCFVQDNLYWKGTLLHFSGSNAAQFYFLAKQNIIDWQILDTVVLSRFDLYFERKLKNTDQISAKAFLAKCQQELKQKNKNIRLEKNNKGFILKIGNRRTNNYSRIYEGKDSLKFEHEMKGKFLQPYHLLFVENNFDNFEQKLSSHFFVYFGKLLPLQYSYLDWLVFKLRPIQKQSICKNSFNSDYIKSEIKADSTTFLTLLQFLNYAKCLDYEVKSLENISYRVVTFTLRDFLQFQNKNENYYQLLQIKSFFEQLQTGIFLTSFSDTFFQSLVAVPLVRFDKINKFWVAKVWLVEELFYYSYPFLLPNFFKTKLGKDQSEVRVKFIRVFSSMNVEKRFFIQEFLTAYPSIISNQRKNNIKKYYIELVQILQEYDLIEPYYKIMSNGSLILTDQLTPSNISEGFVIYEKILL